MDSLVRDLLACPNCGSHDLSTDDSGCRCRDCDSAYPVDNGIPVLIPAATPAEKQASLGSAEQKRQQAAFTDHEVDPEYEITRPRGTPVVHARLLIAKLERSIRGLEEIVRGGTALLVCAGSGMDAEFLARAGARVVCTDISIGGAARARERARRYGLDLSALAADAERLPFRDRCFDLVFVHDGLHHLEQPAVALLEMARVARRAVSVNEPARAALTAAAVRLGLAEEREESGNRVERLRTGDIAELLSGAGFRIVAAERYAMLYRHQAGPIYRGLSRRSLVRAGLVGTQAAERLLAPVGNKLSVRAVRASPADPGAGLPAQAGERKGFPHPRRHASAAAGEQRP